VRAAPGRVRQGTLRVPAHALVGGRAQQPPTDPEWVRSLTPGWQRERARNFTTVLSGGQFDVDLLNDGWTDIIGNVVLAARRKASAGETVEDPGELIQMADFAKMERVRGRVDEIVRDSVTAAALKPWYDQFCKRPCFHDEYLPTFNRPNVHLVDTQGKGVERSRRVAWSPTAANTSSTA
jgi:cyclohexanone monooxygenase